jgi:hypothetical protein
MDKDRSAIDFSSLILERTQFFTGRSWVFKTIHEWFRQSDGPRFFLVSGKPGSGKTAIAARLCQFSRGEADSPEDLPAFQTKGFLNAYHFCSARHGTWNDPRSFTRSLASQLAGAHPEFKTALLATGDKTININAVTRVGTAEANSMVAAVVIENLSLSAANSQEMFNRIIADALQNIYEKGFDKPITILVDSLDESVHHKGNINIAGLLSRVKELPEQVRFILTTRDDDRLSFDFLRDAEVLMLSEPDHEENNNKDIREYVRARMNDDAALSEKAKQQSPDEVDGVIKTIVNKAEGNFLYVAFLLNTLAKPQRALTDLVGLPTGLEGLYYDWIQRVIDYGGGNWNSGYSPVMGVLSVAQAPVTFAQIQRFTTQQTNEVWQSLNNLQQFVKDDVVSDASEPVYRLYHQSVIDFLRSRLMKINNKQVNNLYYLEPSEWHLRIADHYLGQPDLSQWDDYGVRYVVTHLAETAQASAGPGQYQQVKRLIELVTAPGFQQVHKQSINDLPLLQRDLERALKSAAASQDMKTLPLLVKIATAITAFRRQELRPEPLFELARQGEVEDAKHRLELFEIDVNWKQITLLTIAWLAADQRPDLARDLRNHVKDLLSGNRTVQLLMAHLDYALDGTLLPPPDLPPAPPEHFVQQLVANLGGSGADTELISAYRHEMSRRPTVPYADGEGKTPGYFAEDDAAPLVAYADENPPDGDRYLRQYIAIHTGYNYVEYRNRSLLYLLDAVLRSHNQQWIKDTLPDLAVSALAGNAVEFQEGLLLAVWGLRAMAGVPNDFEAQHAQTLAKAAQLSNTRDEGDSWGHFRRRFASFAQIYSVLLDRDADAADLLENAINLPYGFAGFNAPASLFVAEVAHVCNPANSALVNQALDAALNSAHNIQDATFCARSTARVNAMRKRWWGPNPLDIRELIPRFCKDPSLAEFTPLHRIGEEYDNRQSALPPKFYKADRLSALADIYQRPLNEFLRLNREQKLTADKILEPGTEVFVPDPGFVSILAPRFAAEALCDATLSPAQRTALIQQLVPIAAISPTALDTVLARLLLAARLDDDTALEEITELSYRSLTEGLSAIGPERRPFGILS